MRFLADVDPPIDSEQCRKDANHRRSRENSKWTERFDTACKSEEKRERR
jgi:hypothetical protein